MLPDLKAQLYFYKAEVIKITDGDSFWGSLNRGFYDNSIKNIRLARIDAWEKTGSEKAQGLIAKTFVEKVMSLNSEILVQTLGLDAFGRVVSEVYVELNEKIFNLSDLLVEEGHAIYQVYDGLKSF